MWKTVTSSGQSHLGGSQRTKKRFNIYSLRWSSHFANFRYLLVEPQSFYPDRNWAEKCATFNLIDSSWLMKIYISHVTTERRCRKIAREHNWGSLLFPLQNPPIHHAGHSIINKSFGTCRVTKAGCCTGFGMDVDYRDDKRYCIP